MPFDPTTVDAEWPPEKIKAVLLSELRRLYASAVKLIEEAELENRDARVNGKSYKERKVLVAKIDLGNEILKELVKRSEVIKSRITFTAKDFITDDDNLPAIERLGFEGFLRELVKQGYPHIHNPSPLALSRVKGYTDGVKA